MELMVVKDVMLGRNGQVILTGPLLVKAISRRSDIERAFGARVSVLGIDGRQARVPVRGVSVSQAMSGSWQVSVAVDCPSGMNGVALDSLVTAGSSS